MASLASIISVPLGIYLFFAGSKSRDLNFYVSPTTIIVKSGVSSTLRARSDGPGPVMVLAESGHGYKAGHPLKTPKEWSDSAYHKAGVTDFSWHCLRHYVPFLTMSGNRASLLILHAEFGSPRCKAPGHNPT